MNCQGIQSTAPEAPFEEFKKVMEASHNGEAVTLFA